MQEPTHPITIKRVVETRATFLPRRSQTSPTNTCPMIAPTNESQDSSVYHDAVDDLPTSKLLETCVATAAVYALGYKVLKTTYLKASAGEVN